MTEGAPFARLIRQKFAGLMFAHQLIAETVPSIDERAAPPSVNESDAVRRLLEKHTGFAQFRVVLPGTVIWAPRSDGRGETVHGGESTLEEAVRSYLQEDRSRIVDAIQLAIRERRGFRVVARMKTKSGGVRVIETIGDVKVENGIVTELFGLARDISQTVEREAMAISRARLIRHMVEDIPVPVVVLDRALRVVGCSADWTRAYGLPERAATLEKPLGKLIDVSREMTSAIIEALNGRTAHIGLWFYSGDDRRQIRRNCAVIPWQCGTEAAGGVLMVMGGGEASYASAEIADRALGRSMHGLLEVLESIDA